MEAESKPGVNLLWVGLLVEGGLLFIAVVLGWLGLCDHDQPLNQLDVTKWKYGFTWGVIASIPMFVYLLVFHFWTPAFFKPMRQFIDAKMRPMFNNSTILELFILSMMAGLGEELFFRWCLQGGITWLLDPLIGTAASIGVGLVIASTIFGICHWVNATYGITTILVGAYLGATMVWTGTWLVPAIAHALFDFVALIYIVRSPVKDSA